MTWHGDRTFGSMALLYRGINKSKQYSNVRIESYNNLELLLVPQTSLFSNTKIYSFHTGLPRRSQEPSSKVEETIQNLKDEKEEKKKLEAAAQKQIVQASEKAVEKKKTMWQRVKHELLHYYHGFRLLALDVKVSAKLIWRILKGNELSRREHRLVCLFIY